MAGIPPDDRVETGCSPGIDRERQPQDEVQPRRHEPAAEAQRAADEEHAERLGRDRHGRDGQGDPDVARQRERLAVEDDRNVGREGDEDGADHDQGRVTCPLADPLADRDRDEEIPDRDPALTRRQPVEAGGRECHLPLHASARTTDWAESSRGPPASRHGNLATAAAPTPGWLEAKLARRSPTRAPGREPSRSGRPGGPARPRRRPPAPRRRRGQGRSSTSLDRTRRRYRVPARPG